MTSAGFTVSENRALLVPPAASVTVAVKLTGPDDVGIPASTPLVLMVSQLGRGVVVQTYGDTPLAATTENCCEYETPAVAVGSGETVPMATPGAIGPTNCSPAFTLLTSVATTVYW